MTDYFYRVNYSYRGVSWEYGYEIYENRDELIQGLEEMLAKHDCYIDDITQYVHEKNRWTDYEYSKEYTKRLPSKLQTRIEANNEFYVIYNGK